ncbi:piggyBac transposable element-derived protein 1-like [Cryptotermes secundus]|uniref:piggyBac transposable element-derived protein 1-like n=1 Tax=Cryptotermes secundus TaxID=105785 RepID=UPI000CD7D065|nr:piggyBac transposable element-derived protein 1-like [Cryptotermes secundus]
MARRHVKAADIPGLLEEDVISDFELSDSEVFTSDSSGSEISTSTSSPPASSPVRISESSDSDLGGTVESIHWTEVAESNIQAQLPFCYTETEGPKHIPSPPMTPIQYFYLFFTTSLLNSIVTQTNNYATTFLQSQKNIPPHSRILKWTDVTVTELKGFIACLLNMGIKGQPTISSYWSVSPSLNNPWFRSMFSRNRFQLILKFFHLVDNKNLAGP